MGSNHYNISNLNWVSSHLHTVINIIRHLNTSDGVQEILDMRLVQKLHTKIMVT